jgi:transglutaminase-like putative cysteine protease
MTAFNVWHKTTYRYRRPVVLGPHRLQLRPRESRDLRIVSADIFVTPSAPLTWSNDVFGNAIATVSFPAPSDTLIVESRVVLEHDSEPWPLFGISASATSYPFRYSDEERLDLGALLVPQHADPHGRLLTWAEGFIRSFPTDTLSLLKDINAAISAWISYQSRDDEGTQAPLATLDRGWGSCRDIALLLIEAVRRLGFGARIVSGYLANQNDASRPMIGSTDAGSTHAWAEIYLPGAGWVTFDPTNRTVGKFSLIPVAVGRDIAQVVPVTGSFTGVPDDFLGMTVEISIGRTASQDRLYGDAPTDAVRRMTGTK